MNQPRVYMKKTNMEDDTMDSPVVIKEWTRFNLITCEKCLEHSLEQFDEMLECLFKATGVPKKDLLYKSITKLINEKFSDDEKQAKDSRRQGRTLINECLTETAQHVCLSRKNKPALRSIADELLLLPNLFSLDPTTKQISFQKLENFQDFSGKHGIELGEHGRRAIQSSERNSKVMLRGRKLYDRNPIQNQFEINIQIENFHSTIYIGVCSDNVSPNDIESGSNVFPIDQSLTCREGDTLTLLIDVDQFTIYLWNNYRSKKHQNSEIHKRERSISKHRCPLPWRFFVILSGRDNHIRIVY